jgi:hypothetical protein
VCTGPQRLGADDGAACEPDNVATSEDEDGCSGLCLVLDDPKNNVSATMCTSRCSLGGDGMDCGGPSNGVCALPRVESNESTSQLGDQGFCAPSCISHDTCDPAGGLFCLDLGNQGSFGVGYCVPAVSCDNGGLCPDELVCTNTGLGEFCLNDTGDGLLYPLQSP